MEDKLGFMHQALEAAKAEKRFINIRTMDSAADGWMVVDGKKVLNFCTNNYLGLANHPVLKEAAKKAVELEPEDSNILDTLAEVCFRLGDRDKAIEIETRAIELAPDDAYLKEQLERFRMGEE